MQHCIMKIKESNFIIDKQSTQSIPPQIDK